MHKGKYVFAQLLDFIDKDVFLRLANKYDGNRYVKQFTCWNQLAVLMFGQLSNRESLRDVILATQAHASKAYHLGFGKHAAKSTLANANTKRDYRIFEEFAYKVIAETQRCRIVDICHVTTSVSKWYDYINEPTLADAIMDRLTANTVRLELKGDSLRRKNQK